MSAVYLDNCATTEVCKEAAAAAADAMTVHYGNPSSLHGMGVASERLLRSAREQVAYQLSCAPEEIIFTSGGTEANNLAIFGAARALKRRGKRIVTTSVEHPSAAQPIGKLEKEGFEVIRLKPGTDGCVSEDDLVKAVTRDTILVSIMLVNNETGAIQPVAAARRALSSVSSPGLLHCDAVQAFAKLRFTPAKLGADLLSLSAHKLHGPKGAGALFVSKRARIEPQALGGGQERGLRSGTEPVPAIAGFGEATRVAFEGFDKYTARMSQLRELCLNKLSQLPFVELNSPVNGAVHILNFSVKGVRSETMLHYLASKSIYISSGSACGRGRRSSVLAAQGLPDARVDSALRVSFSRMNTQDDVDALIQGILEGERELEHFR